MTRGILFGAPMVRALLSGAKTQTRRLVGVPSEARPSLQVYDPHEVVWDVPGACSRLVRVPFRAGEQRWVKESWRTASCLDALSPTAIAEQCLTASYTMPWAPIEYQADRAQVNYDPVVWPAFGRLRPSMFMPRWASRLTLDVTGLRVERLQDISDEDARAEGVADVGAFQELWQSLHGKKPQNSWGDNPWVWVVALQLKGPQ